MVIFCYLSRSFSKISTRFVQTPNADVRKRLESDAATVEKDTENLKKKLHYLEMTQKNAEEALQRLLGGGG